MEYRVKDHRDGTFEVAHYHPNTGSRLNAEYFPDEEEAVWYADAMNGGCLHAGALMRVHEKRIEKARATHISATVPHASFIGTRKDDMVIDIAKWALLALIGLLYWRLESDLQERARNDPDF